MLPHRYSKPFYAVYIVKSCYITVIRIARIVFIVYLCTEFNTLVMVELKFTVPVPVKGRRALSYRGSIEIHDSKVIVRACLMDPTLNSHEIDMSNVVPAVYSSLDKFFLAVRSVFGSSDILFHHA